MEKRASFCVRDDSCRQINRLAFVSLYGRVHEKDRRHLLRVQKQRIAGLFMIRVDLRLIVKSLLLIKKKS